MTLSNAWSWGLEKVGIIFLGGLEIFTLVKGLLSTISSERSHDQNALIERR